MASAMQNVVRRLSIEATTRGVKEAEQAARGLSKAVDGIAVSGARAEKATQSMEGRLASIQRQYDAQYRAQEKMAKVERDLMQAQQQGILTQQRRLELLSMAAERHGLATAAINREAAATDALAAAQRRQAVTASAANDNSWRRRGLMYQGFDIGTSLAGGINPAVVAAQQGPQIIQMYAGQGGVNAALSDAMGLLGGVAKAFGPVGVAAGVAAVSIGVMRSEIEDTTGVAVTFGDVFKAVFQVIGRGIYDFLEPAISAIAPWFQAAWSLVLDVTKRAFNSLVGGVLGSFELIKAGVKAIPDAFIVAGENAANFFLDGIERLVRGTIVGINTMISSIQSAFRGTAFQSVVDAIPKLENRVSNLRIDIGGAAAMERLAQAAGELDTRISGIVTRDYWGQFSGAVSDAAVANHKAAAEAEKNAGATGNAGDAAKKATDAWDGYRKVTEETTDAVREVESAIEGTARQISNTLGGALGDLFTTPMKDMDQFFDQFASGLANIGRQNLANLFDFEKDGFWDQFSKSQGDGTDAARRAIQAGAAEGTEQGLITAIQKLGVSEGAAKGIVGIGGAALGGYGLGYESGDKTMGALGGAASGFMAGLSVGGPLAPVTAVIGAIIGGLSGLFGASSKAKKEQEAAIQALQKERVAIDAFLSASTGGGIGEYQKTYSEAYRQNVTYQEAASKAGDKSLLRELQDASNQFFTILNNEFVGKFNGMLDALRSGLGSNSPFVQAQGQIDALREQMKGFVADTKFLAEEDARLGGRTGGADIAQKVAEAQAAAQEMLLRQLTGAEKLSDVAAEMKRIDGAAVGLQRALVELGMTAEQAAVEIANAKAIAQDNLRREFAAGIDAKLFEAQGRNWINDLNDLAKQTRTDLGDDTLTGAGKSDEIRQTFELTAQSVVNAATASAEDVAFANTYLADVLAEIGLTIPKAIVDAGDAIQDAADRWAQFDKDLAAKINDATGKGHLNSLTSLLDDVNAMAAMGSIDRIDDINKYMVAATKQIAESSGLTGDAIRQLAVDFPQLGRALASAADGIDQAAAAARNAELAAAAAAAAAARREAWLGLQSGLITRTQGADAAADSELSRLQVGNVSLAGIRGATSADEAKRQLEIFMAQISRTARSAADLTGAGNLAYAAFDSVTQALEQAAKQAEDTASAFTDMQAQITDSLTQFGDRMTSEFDRFTSQVMDEYRRQRSDFFDAASGANAYLNSIATQGTNPETQYNILLDRFRSAASGAANGNPDALRGLTGQADSLLQAAAQYFPQGTTQFDAVLNEVRAAIGTGASAATDRGNEVSAKMDRFISGQDRLAESMQREIAKLIEEVKGLKQGSVMLLDQIAKLLAAGKSDPETVRAIRDLVASNREVRDQLGAIARKAA